MNITEKPTFKVSKPVPTSTFLGNSYSYWEGRKAILLKDQKNVKNEIIYQGTKVTIIRKDNKRGTFNIKNTEGIEIHGVDFRLLSIQ